MRKILSGLAAAVMTLGVVAPAPASAEQEQGVCPEVAVVAARGSEENVDLGPTRYAPDSAWESNGYEGYQVGMFLRFAEAHHVEQTGESLLEDVPVIALDPEVYPAALPLPVLVEEGEEVAARELVQRVSELLDRISVPEIARISLGELARSVNSGVTNTMSYLAGWEAATGCEPDYVLAGYSQGAVVMTAQERKLAEDDRLAGVVYLGNPLLKANDPSLVGGAAPGGGLLQRVPAEWEDAVAEAPRVNYCLPADVVCNLSVTGAVDAAKETYLSGELEDLGAHTHYFTGKAPREYDERAAESFASWILAAQGR